MLDVAPNHLTIGLLVSPFQHRAVLLEPDERNAQFASRIWKHNSTIKRTNHRASCKSLNSGQMDNVLLLNRAWSMNFRVGIGNLLLT